MYEAKIAFLDQVEQWQPAIEITSGDFYDKSQVAFDHALARGFIAIPGEARIGFFFVRSEQRRDANLVEVLAHRIEQLSHFSPPTH